MAHACKSLSLVCTFFQLVNAFLNCRPMIWLYFAAIGDEFLEKPVLNIRSNFRFQVCIGPHKRKYCVC